MIRVYNKIQGNQCLSDMKHLFFNMRELYEAENKDPFHVMPVTFVITGGLNDMEFDRFEEYFTLQAGVWIIKPGEDTNRGSGIIVSRDFAEIKNLVRDKSAK